MIGSILCRERERERVVVQIPSSNKRGIIISFHGNFSFFLEENFYSHTHNSRLLHPVLDGPKPNLV
jgi:hypothetical protein